MNQPCTRRASLKSTAIAGMAVGLTGLTAHAERGTTISVALIGCGGRGKGAMSNFIEACQILGLQADIVALADVFPDAANRLAKQFQVSEERCHTGFDAYRKVMESKAQFVLMATPPLFRPLHLEAMLTAGKHVFIEKPVAVDPVGCRKVIELGELAKQKGLAIVAGTQRRHAATYLKNKALVEAGAIGEILGGTVSWNGNVPWIFARRDEWSDAEYLTRNWLNWTEMSGDHICEQHVHNIDVANWFIGRPPVSALGFGARIHRESGNQYDFFSIDFDYGNNVHIHSQCRQISGCFNRIGEELRGSKGVVFGGGKLIGDSSITVPDPIVDSENELVREHINLIRGVREGKPLNEARAIAESTASAVMGRISAYTGKQVRWSDLFENPTSEWYNFTCAIPAEAFETGAVQLPPENVAPRPGDAKPINRRQLKEG